MDERQLSKIDDLNERFCFDCLVIRTKHAEHCKKCNLCVNYRHKHSRLFGRCIGADNAASYYLILLSSHLVLVSYLLQVLTSCQFYSSNLVFHLIEGAVSHLSSSKLMALFHLSLVFLALINFDHLCSFTTAVTREMTLREMNNVYDYKQCLKIKSHEHGHGHGHSHDHDIES